MRRALSLSLPTWPADRMRRSGRLRSDRSGDEEPALLLAAREGSRSVVVSCCARARRAGVRPGQALADARARLCDVAHEVLPSDPARDADALRSLAAWAGRFSPCVALDPPSGLFLDVAGCERLFSGERRHAERVTEAVLRLGFRCRAAVASTPGCAWALARYGRESPAFVPPGAEREALAPLPVAALRVPPETVEALA